MSSNEFLCRSFYKEWRFPGFNNCIRWWVWVAGSVTAETISWVSEETKTCSSPNAEVLSLLISFSSVCMRKNQSVVLFKLSTHVLTHSLIHTTELWLHYLGNKCRQLFIHSWHYLHVMLPHNYAPDTPNYHLTVIFSQVHAIIDLYLSTSLKINICNTFQLQPQE